MWEMQNVIVSPHSTDNVPGLTNKLQADLFCENLRRYLAGRPLSNELDKGLRYLSRSPRGGGEGHRAAVTSRDHGIFELCCLAKNI